MGMVLAFVFLGGLPIGPSLFILVASLVFALVIESARLRNPSLNQRVLKVLGPLMRASEVNRMSGTPHYLAATIVALAIFPKPVAVLSVLYLACGDPIASLFGILYGDRSIRFRNGKSLIGTLAGVITCTIVGFIFLRSLGMPFPTVLGLGLIGGIAGGTAELLPLDSDDNFTIPVISGFVLWLAFILFRV